MDKLIVLPTQLPRINNFWINAVLGSFGMFFFVDGPYGGMVALLVLVLADYWMALASLITVTSGNIFAVCVLAVEPRRAFDGVVGLNAVQLGLCISLMQPPSWTLVVPLAVLSSFCMVLQEMVIGPMLQRYRRYGLSPMGVPGLLCTMLWRDGLSDAFGVFPPIAAGPLLHTPIDMYHAAYGVGAGVANVGFVPPTASALLLLNGAWLVTSPATCVAMWCGGVIGVISDLVFGTPAHFWTAMSGLNSCLTFTTIFALTLKPSRGSFVIAAIASLAAGAGSSIAGRFGMRGMTWPFHVAIIAVQLGLVAARKEKPV